MSDGASVISLATERAHRLVLQELQIFRAEMYAKMTELQREVRTAAESAESAKKTAEGVQSQQKQLVKLLVGLLLGGTAAVGPEMIKHVIAMFGGV